MKKLLGLLLIMAFAFAGFTQEMVTEYKATSSTQFGKYMKAPIQVYLADSAKTYLLIQSQTRHRTMSNVFAQGALYYKQVTAGSTSEAEIVANAAAIAVNAANIDTTVLETDTNYTATVTNAANLDTTNMEVDTNYAGLLQLNARASHTITKLVSLYQTIKYPLMTCATYDFAVDGGTISTITLYGDTAFIPANAIIIKVLQDVITAPNSATSNGTIKFVLATEGDLTLNITADNSTTGLLFGIPGTYALDGNALTAANMGIAEAGTYIKTAAARSIDVEIGTANLTAGKIRLYVWYVVSE